MYADRYGHRNGLKPGSVMLALGMTALPILGLVVSAHVQGIIKNDPVFKTINIATPKPPPPPRIDPKPQPETKAPPIDHIVAPLQPLIPVKPINPIGSTEILPPPPSPGIPGTGEVGTIPQPARPLPLLTEAGIDPRYANAFQPPYPAEEVRAGREGRVVIRVLIGADGRVHQVEKVSATTDAFFAAAQRQALTKWRFKPATRDGVAIEQWKQMSLRFQLDGDD